MPGLSRTILSMPTGDSRTVIVRDVPVEPLRHLIAATPGVVLAVVFGSAAGSQHARAIVRFDHGLEEIEASAAGA